MRVLKDIVLVNLVPFMSYFEIDEFLTTLDFTPAEIAAIKAKEHKKRITYVYNDYNINRKIEGILHCEDGPARIWASGSREWFINGKHHNSNGPALVLYDGTQAWYVNGKLHRTDGPAKIYADGTKQYWINGVHI